jgi:hypothetical protein
MAMASCTLINSFDRASVSSGRLMGAGAEAVDARASTWSGSGDHDIPGGSLCGTLPRVQ